MKKLVAYFSATGRTKRLAETLAASEEADIFEIRPAKPYTKEDLDWMNGKSRSSVECNDKSIKPAMVSGVDISEYDVIFVGYPVWWYREPNIINTFLESGKTENKIIVPFATSGGSPIGDAPSYLKEAAPAARITKGKVFSPKTSEAEILLWAEAEIN